MNAVRVRYFAELVISFCLKKFKYLGSYGPGISLVRKKQELQQKAHHEKNQLFGRCSVIFMKNVSKFQLKISVDSHLQNNS